MKLSEVGPWSETKLEILAKYVEAYNKVLKAQEWAHRIYIDAFAGAGEHVSKTSGELIPGSPQRALYVEPPFDEYHLIEKDRAVAQHLREVVREAPRRVTVYEGDCNRVLLNQVFPRVEESRRNRAFCLLDPYGIHLEWNVLCEAARSRQIEILLNFSMMDIKMNFARRDPATNRPEQAPRMTAFWGDESWREAVYTTDLPQPNLFDEPETTPADVIADAFAKRLKEVAGFRFVVRPLAMRNTRNGTVYHLIFAGPNGTGAKIMGDIFDKYRET